MEWFPAKMPGLVLELDEDTLHGGGHLLFGDVHVVVPQDVFKVVIIAA